ncbi:ABC transporter permease [Natronospirillum operosum]|uniref:ABC transporter permease n=1 Tax=Natronospirillum operosum TaxID=2759953 RepID=A0A4Z0WFD1_9GAMM|nr:ABC transporter permease [Natronospirillum operosum]TGG94006.1 ABC transporter permease [Natronospirillum operosum]
MQQSASASSSDDHRRDGKLVTADGRPLQASLRSAERRRKIIAFLFVSPLLAFLLISFVIPIGQMMWRSVDNPTIINTLPRTLEAMQEWDGQNIPDEPVFAALAEDLREAQQNRRVGPLAVRLNYEISGARGALSRKARSVATMDAPYREQFLESDRLWQNPRLYQIIQREGRPLTLSYYVAATDRAYDADGNIVRRPEQQRIYMTLFGRTFAMSAAILVLTLLLGFPIAFWMAHLPMRYANLLMIMVLLPFWTSLLVRTTSWIVLLQQQGVINSSLVALGILDSGNRLSLMYNMTGTIIAMTHILLPFMVLPLYSVMKTIPPSYMRAARSLGANNWTAFWRVYVPQTVPGIGAGGVLVFIISIGYYITPALVGGQSGRMISNMIAYHMQNSLNWGLAAALGTMLLVSVLILYWAYNKLVGADIKLG